MVYGALTIPVALLSEGEVSSASYKAVGNGKEEVGNI